MLALKTISDKYMGQGKNIYCCFVDFKKAFDTLWHEGLLYKLLKKGIGGPFAEIIRTMYDKSEAAIKLSGGITEKFKGNIGVKQSCVMSHPLFNFVINDIHETLDHLDCDPVLLHNLTICCLLFADDIVLLSQTAEGLQNSLDRLCDYCNKWLLTINAQKTQILVMNKQGRCPDLHFTFNNEPLQVVKQYKYLGLLITS